MSEYLRKCQRRKAIIRGLDTMHCTVSVWTLTFRCVPATCLLGSSLPCPASTSTNNNGPFNLSSHYYISFEIRVIFSLSIVLSCEWQCWEGFFPANSIWADCKVRTRWGEVTGQRRYQIRHVGHVWRCAAWRVQYWVIAPTTMYLFSIFMRAFMIIVLSILNIVQPWLHVCRCEISIWLPFQF